MKAIFILIKLGTLNITHQTVHLGNLRNSKKKKKKRGILTKHPLVKILRGKYSHVPLSDADTFPEVHPQAISSLCEHHRVHSNNQDGIAYYTPTLHCIGHCSWATNLHSMLLYKTTLWEIVQSRDAINKCIFSVLNGYRQLPHWKLISSQHIHWERK